MNTRRRIVYGTLVVVAAGGLAIVVGRTEGAHQARVQNRGFERLIKELGPKWPATARGYRQTPYFACLLYGTASVPTGIELCFDPEGRVVEGIDRRTNPVKFWTLRFNRAASHVRLPLPRLLAILRARGVPDAQTSVPLAPLDLGPHVPVYPLGCHPEMSSDDWEVVVARLHTNQTSSANTRAYQVAKAAHVGLPLFFSSAPVGVHDFDAVAKFCSGTAAKHFLQLLVKTHFAHTYGYPPPTIHRHPRGG